MCIKESRGQTGLEQPPLSMAWLQPDNVTLLRELAVHCAHLASAAWTCISRGMFVQASQAWPHRRPQARPHLYVSSHTAEYPLSLAAQLAQLMTPFCTSLGLGGPVTLPTSFPSLSCIAGLAMGPAAIATSTTPILLAPADCRTSPAPSATHQPATIIRAYHQAATH